MTRLLTSILLLSRLAFFGSAATAAAALTNNAVSTSTQEQDRLDRHRRLSEARETSINSLYNVADIEHAPAPPAVVGPKTVLLTGAAGFVGSHVAEFLLKRGDTVLVLDEVNDYYDVRIKESNLKLLQDLGGDDRVHIFRGNICNATLVRQIMETHAPGWIVHLAARAGVRPSILDPFVYIRSNIQGTARLFEMALEFGVLNFVVASSSSVYGGSSSTLFDEHENVDFPISPYAASKRVTELLGTYYHHHASMSILGRKLPVTALRFFTVYGPRGRPDMAPFKFIDWTARGKPIQQFGNGSSSRDYTYIDDIVQGVVGALDRPTPVYQNVNLGKGSGTSLAQFVELVAKYVGKQPRIEILPDQPGDVPYTCANVTLAHTVLDYSPTVPFETGIQKTVEWYKSVYPYDKQERQETPSQGQPQVAELSQDEKNENDFDQSLSEPQIGATSRRRRRRRRLQEGPLPPRPPPHTQHKKVLVVAHQESTFLTEHMVNTLTSRGDDVAVLIPSNSMHAAISPHEYTFSDNNVGKVSVHVGCVDNATLIEYVLNVERPSWIAYLNRLTNVTESKQDPYTFIDVNIQAFVRMLEAVKHKGIQNFVYTSSTNVYLPSHVWHAEDETIPNFSSPFAVTQKGRELFSHTWHKLYKIPMTALRLPALYGPGHCAWCNVNGPEAETVQEFMYVQDAVDGLIRALDRPFKGYLIINLGQGLDLVEEACQSLSSLREMIFSQLQGHYFVTTVARPCALAKISLAQAYLGFTPQVRLRQGIRRVASWLRHNPKYLPDNFSLLVVDEDKMEDYVNYNNDGTLPWRSNSLASAAVSSYGEVDQDGEDEGNRVRAVIGQPMPAWVESLTQLQWILVAAFLAYKFFSWNRQSSLSEHHAAGAGRRRSR